MDHWSAGDWTGLAGGSVVLLGALGKALAWLLNWQGARETRRSQRLTEWERSLNIREKEYREQLEHELIAIRRAVRALGGALIEVTVELRGHNPESAAVERAMKFLREHLPAEFFAPAEDGDDELDTLARRLDERDPGQ